MESSFSRLPIHQCKDLFLTSLSSSQCIIIEGRAGTGKSTLIPQWAVEFARREGKNKLVACTQTRRLAAVSLAGRVAEEMGVKMGEEVGFAIRDEERGGSSLKYCTTGWMLREMHEKPLLDEYSVVVVDEVNDRTLYLDILLGKLKELLSRRPDLKVVLMGSSIESAKMERYFGSGSLIEITSPSTPIDIVYSPIPDSTTRLFVAVETVLNLARTEPDSGDILLFLATIEEVEQVREEIGRRGDGLVKCIPLHSSITGDELKHVYTSGGGRRCIASTSIGETAVVFDGVSFVIDAVRGQRSFYDPLAAISPVVSISKMTARRRAERAGKRVIRLYSEKEYDEMERETTPEVLVASKEKVEELLKICGVKVEELLKIKKFDFIDKPSNLSL